ncbi:MAG: carbonic anhydrase [Desulfovibrio sp.]|nr:carbonic anhydrase [Desulfovibrio sp.]MCA1984991.1 carbonic anhydrase [Desulfovibrio sp.]
MTKSLRMWMLVLALVALPFAASALSEGPGVTAEQAMALLVDGNARFVRGEVIHPNQREDRRKDTSLNGQHPFVTVLSCADSRVPPEILFDRGIGDVFSVRVAGNVAAVDEIGTIEYGTEHLGTPLLVVLGHTQCGAVTAVVRGDQVGGSIPQLVAPIAPVAERVKAAMAGQEMHAVVAAAIEENVWQVIDDIFKGSPIVRHLVQEGKLSVQGAMYVLESGVVRFMGKHPEEARLLAYTGGPGGH